MLAVVAAASAQDGSLVRWNLELSLGEHRPDCGAILLLEFTRVRSDSAIDQRLERLVDQLLRATAIDQRTLGAALGRLLARSGVLAEQGGTDTGRG